MILSTVSARLWFSMASRIRTGGWGGRKVGHPTASGLQTQVSWPLPQLESPTYSLPHLKRSIPLPTVAPFLVWNIVDPSLQSNPCPRLP